MASDTQELRDANTKGDAPCLFVMSIQAEEKDPKPVVCNEVFHMIWDGWRYVLYPRSVQRYSRVTVMGQHKLNSGTRHMTVMRDADNRKNMCQEI